MDVPWIPPPMITIDFGATADADADADIVRDEKAWVLVIVVARRSWWNLILICIYYNILLINML